ncbi:MULTISPECIES: BMC domain-containing protein [Enterobacterales]|uniref:BMC domain-containing protein n=1 Tax=Enterobacterales TaxID=91347 RepID=UPI002ED8D9A9
MKQSLGLLEVSGLALAITCADAMAKAAAITLPGFEKTNGSGWMLIKITGDVASVQAAVITGANIAKQQHGLVAHKVIARPASGILQQPAAASISPESVGVKEEKSPEDAAIQEEVQKADLNPALCNLCLDPACQRQKGEPRTLCLHAGK